MLEEACRNCEGERGRFLLMFAAKVPDEVMKPVPLPATRPSSEPCDEFRVSNSLCKADILSMSSRAGMLPSSTIEWSNVKDNVTPSPSSVFGRRALEIIRTIVAENV